MFTGLTLLVSSLGTGYRVLERKTARSWNLQPSLQRRIYSMLLAEELAIENHDDYKIIAMNILLHSEATNT